jgi:hypothetical protein
MSVFLHPKESLMRLQFRPTSWLIVPLVVLAMSVSGCFGILWFGDHEWPVRVSGRLDKVKMEKLEMMWGKPTIVQDESGREIRTYQQNKFRWNGALLFVVIPLPILIPVGYERYTAIVEQGKYVSATHLDGTIRWGAMCGFAFNLHDSSSTGFHCGLGKEH